MCFIVVVRGSMQCVRFPLLWPYWGHLHYRHGVGSVSGIYMWYEISHRRAEVSTTELAV